MCRFQQIQEILDYIEAHLWEDVTPETLCRESHYSLFHFCRLFEYAVGLPVKQYVLRRKLLWSAWLLARG
ncbi:MAG: helix-turn-helix transcriptional regulator, partial [Clostridia bacterium]|nr:helix-turn-helix transcriptional regulator [Clostridia bacterium]